jgi:hypothetical protein
MDGSVKTKILEIAKSNSDIYNITDILINEHQVMFVINSDVITDVIYKNGLEKPFLDRISIIKDFLFRNLTKFKYELTINVIFNLNDSSPYILGSGEFVFAKNKNINKPLCPNLYGMLDYKNLNIPNDTIEFKDKKNSAIFVGASTGEDNVCGNIRLKISDYYKNSQFVNSYINKIVQIPKKDIFEKYKDYSKFILNYNISIKEQYEYKYIIDIDGNNTSWDRLKWIFKGNSECIKQKTDNVEWYYPMLNNQLIFFDDYIILDSIIENLNGIENFDYFNDIIKNAQLFEKNILNENTHGFYFMNVLKFLTIR